MFQRIWSLSIKEFFHLRNDWWLPAFMLLGGGLELLLVGWATSRPITNLPMVVLDHDQSRASRELVAALENTGTFRLENQVVHMEEIETGMDRGEINAALIFPPGYGAQLASPAGSATVAVILNGADSISAVTALRAIEGTARNLGEKITIERLGLSTLDVQGFIPSLKIRFNEALSEALYTTPAEMSLMLEFTILLFAALSITRERELGTLEQLLVMPFSSLEIILGKSIPVVIIGFVNFAIMLGVVHFAFRVPVRGPLPLLLAIALIYIFVELGKGFVISVVSKTQHQAFLLVTLVAMVDFMFTGYAVPVESMPVMLRTLANFIPAHHWLDIVRGVMLKDTGFFVLLPRVLALIALGLVIGGFSFRYVRRSLD